MMIMVRYQFFYKNDNLDQNEKFIIFSLHPITENSELNLTQALALWILPMVIEPNKYDEFS